jgi:hypothetical protein
MLTTKIVILVLPLTMLGLFGSAILPHAAYSQTDYEEYLIVETNTEKKLNQQNTGSGSSTNINCGTNISGTNLQQPITCPSVPGETPTPTLIPVVTQRVVEVPITPFTFTEAESPCNPDEVVTGGGFDVTDIALGGGGGISTISSENAGLVVEEFAVNNAWHIKVSPGNSPIDTTPTIQVFAECLKLVPA